MPALWLPRFLLAGLLLLCTCAQATMSESVELTRVHMTLDVKDDVVVYSPKEGVMSASYPKFIFDRKDWDQHVGSDSVPDGTVIEYKVAGHSESTYKPDDPSMPQPEGRQAGLLILVPIMVSRGTALVLLCGCLAGISLQSVLLAFTTISKPSSAVRKATNVAVTAPRRPVLNGDLVILNEDDYDDVSPWDTAFRLLSGFVVGALLLSAMTSPAFADNLEETAIPVDGKGKTITLTKEEIIRGKRLFNNACANCHVGGGTRTNQNVGLGFEELSGAQPPRNNIDSLVDYINAPTTYDGLKDIAEVHPSIKAADVWPKMQTMKQKDLYDISSYILYQNFTIPEKWGGGKQYY